MIVVATFAWFTRGHYANIRGLDSDVTQASYIEISGDNGENWSSDLNMELGINRNFKEISGDGIQFFKPVYDVVEKPTGGLAPAIIQFEKVDHKDYFYEHVFTFRGNASREIYLAPESYVRSVSDDGSSHIDGAIRVAFIEVDEYNRESLKCIWAPNSNIVYSPDTGSFSDAGPTEGYYYYQTSETPVDVNGSDEALAGNLVKISTADPEALTTWTECGYNEEYKFMWSCRESLPSNAPSLLSLGTSAGAISNEKKLLVRVWLEGYDRECVSELSGQGFTMNFEFDAIKGE
jgi:hypothetical protein